MEELDIYKAKYIKDMMFKEVIKKVLDILEEIEGYSVWYDFTRNLFNISLSIDKGEKDEKM